MGARHGGVTALLRGCRAPLTAPHFGAVGSEDSVSDSCTKRRVEMPSKPRDQWIPNHKLREAGNGSMAERTVLPLPMQ